MVQCLFTVFWYAILILPYIIIYLQITNWYRYCSHLFWRRKYFVTLFIIFFLDILLRNRVDRLYRVLRPSDLASISVLSNELFLISCQIFILVYFTSVIFIVYHSYLVHVHWLTPNVTLSIKKWIFINVCRMNDYVRY